MSRLVVEEGEAKDGFAAKIAKYVPAEVLALYITIDNILKDLKLNNKVEGVDKLLVENGPSFLFWGCVIAIPAYLAIHAQKGAEKYFVHSVISMILFPIWVYSIKGQYFELNHSAALSSILLALVTAASGAIPSGSADEIKTGIKGLLPGKKADGEPAPAEDPK